jgi:hypothetical protein
MAAQLLTRASGLLELFCFLLTNRTASFGSLVDPQEAKFMRRSTLDW